jgi:branched-subunit amino acid ABC-type transport system permease component
MRLDVALLALPGVVIVLCLCAFVLQRFLWKHPRRGKKRLQFYPTTYAMGLALQQIQTFVAPNMEYTIEEKVKEGAEEDDEGDPDDPTRHLERQLKQIRRGERLDALTTFVHSTDETKSIHPD